MKNIFLFFFLLMCVTCSDEDVKLRQALDASGDNRHSLEVVLSHYQNDSLKLEAAKFLIRNMPGHCSYVGRAIKEYYQEINQVLQTDSSWSVKEKMVNEIYARYPSKMIESEQDIKIVSADYLIKNIDRAFDDWENGSWAKHVKFSDFCEYMLPYKCVDYQALDAWRDTLSKVAEHLCDDYKYSRIKQNSSYWAASAFNDSLGRLNKVHLSDAMKNYSLFAGSLWTKIPSGRCGVYSLISVAMLRSKGIPVVNDFILQWPTKDGDHSWVTLLTEAKNKGYLEGNEGGVMGFIRPGECKGKVYRRTYAPDDALVQLCVENKYVPEKLRNVFMKDVTAEYVQTKNVQVLPLSEKKMSKERYAYLSVYGNNGWVPVCFSRLKGGRFLFENIEPGAVYLPSYYTRTGVVAMNYPFVLSYNRGIHYLVPDKRHLKKITLHRKFPLMKRAFEKGQCLKGSLIQASNYSDFRECDTIFEFTRFTLSGHVVPKNNKTYRYWRYLCTGPYNCYIAELGFYDNNGKKLKGEIIGTGQYYGDDSRFSKEAAFDEDPFTFYISDLLYNGWIGMDFGSPISIGKIDYLARSDDNNIRIGDEYELFYWDVDGWVSLGTQVAMDLELVYENVPENALLILRDHTRGKDERIFVYQATEQKWY
jgi:hypothetical protein